MNKQNLLKSLFTLLLLLGSVDASAQEFYVNSIGYKISSNSATVVNGKNAKGDVILPDYVTYNNKEYRVTSIGENAFESNKNLTSIILPDDVTGIEKNAFNGCKSLTSVILPEGLKYIRISAFSGCMNLTSINLPEGLTSIAVYAFQNCRSLTSVTLPESLITLSTDAFRNCTSLTSITIPKNVTTIKEQVFYGCTGLTSITISEGVKAIEARAFSGCSSLTSITIPKSVTNMEIYAFDGCGANEIILNCNIPGGVSSTGLSTFSGSSFNKYIINETVTEIGSYAFIGCKGEIIINSNQLSSYGLGGYTNKFSKITFGENVTSIPDRACLRCTNLTTVIIPESVTSIGTVAFNGCTNITDLYCNAKTPPSTGEEAFDESAFQNVKLHVPTKYQKLYQAVAPWNKFTNFAIDVTAITLSQSEATIAEGETFTLTATVAPENATDKSIKWSSSDKTVAYVDSKGQISALNPGVATITATARDAGGVSASCEVNVVPASYVITYIIDDEVYATDTIVRGTPIEPIQPQKEGHTFSGWTNIPEIMPAKDITVIGIFVPNDYLVTFKIGDEVIATMTLEYGAKITVPEAPKKEGYTFNGWGEVAETVPAGDVTYEGSYTINTYLLTYTVDGETVKADSVVYGTAITALAEPTKEGYTFSGWSEIPATMPAKDVKVTGSFTINKYTLTYTVDGETYKTYELEYGAAITAENEPTKEGHTFCGWSEIPETMPAKDVTVAGTFTANTYKVTYILDGEVFKVEEVVYGTAIPTPDVPAKEGYNFSGWGEIPESMPAHDVTLTGSYTINKDMKYNLIYMVDGVEYKRVTLSFGDAIVLEAEPTKEGHTFSGWSEVPETMPLHNVTVTGSFTANSYTLIYILDGEIFKSEKVVFGTTIIAPEAPDKEGHTFVGWDKLPETMPAKDVIVMGKYAVNTYKVYYYVGEELVHTEEVTYGEAIPEYIYEPEEGYTFVGWIGESYETMPAHDVTYTANIESGIDSLITNGQQLMVIYDLTGRKVIDVDNLKAGIYIINGKKTVIK